MTNHNFFSVKRITFFMPSVKWFARLKTSLSLILLLTLTCCHLNVFGQSNKKSSTFYYADLTEAEQEIVKDFRPYLNWKNLPAGVLPGSPVSAFDPAYIQYPSMHIWVGKETSQSEDYIFIIFKGGKKYLNDSAEINFLHEIQSQTECKVVRFHHSGSEKTQTSTYTTQTTFNNLIVYIRNFATYRKNHSLRRFPYKFVIRSYNVQYGNHIRIQAKISKLQNGWMPMQSDEYVELVSFNATLCCQCPPDFGQL